MRSTTITMIAAIGCSLPLPAMAAEDRASASVRVSHRDLDLSTGEGVAALRQRVRNAVRRACAEAADGTWFAYDGQSQCRLEAQKLANRQIEQQRSLSLARLSTPGG